MLIKVDHYPFTCMDSLNDFRAISKFPYVKDAALRCNCGNTTM